MLAIDLDWNPLNWQTVTENKIHTNHQGELTNKFKLFITKFNYAYCKLKWRKNQIKTEKQGEGIDLGNAEYKIIYSWFYEIYLCWFILIVLGLFTLKLIYIWLWL